MPGQNSIFQVRKIMDIAKGKPLASAGKTAAFAANSPQDSLQRVAFAVKCGEQETTAAIAAVAEFRKKMSDLCLYSAVGETICDAVLTSYIEAYMQPLVRGDEFMFDYMSKEQYMDLRLHAVRSLLAKYEQAPSTEKTE